MCLRIRDWHTDSLICFGDKISNTFLCCWLGNKNIKRNQAYKSCEDSWKHLPLKCSEQVPSGAPSLTVWLTTCFTSQPHCFPQEENPREREGWQKTQHEGCLTFLPVFLKTLWQQMSLNFTWKSFFTYCELRLLCAQKWQMEGQELALHLHTFTVRRNPKRKRSLTSRFIIS